MPINTTTTPRRKLRFNTIADVRADLDILESAHNRGSLIHLGNWPPGALFEHLALGIEGSFIGFGDFRVRWLLRIFAPWVKDRVLSTSLSPGNRLPEKSERMAWNENVTFESGINRYREQLARLESGKPGRALPNPALIQRHPAFGTLTPPEWVLFHLRHAELHLSFLKP